jgi:hypothetical protein
MSSTSRRSIRRELNHAYAVAVHQHFGHHQRIVGWLAALLVPIHRVHRRQIQLIHYVADEIRQMFLRQPITQARRQQQIFIRVVPTVAFAHGTLCGHPVSERQQKLYRDIDFSDGLLDKTP